MPGRVGKDRLLISIKSFSAEPFRIKLVETDQKVHIAGTVIQQKIP